MHFKICSAGLGLVIDLGLAVEWHVIVDAHCPQSNSTVQSCKLVYSMTFSSWCLVETSQCQVSDQRSMYFLVLTEI